MDEEKLLNVDNPSVNDSIFHVILILFMVGVTLGHGITNKLTILSWIIPTNINFKGLFAYNNNKYNKNTILI